MATPNLFDKVAGIVGSEHVIRDDAEREFFSTDLSMEAGEIADLVVAPASPEEVAALVRVAGDAGVPLAPRGGGMSYTHTFVPGRPGALLLDMRRMKQIEVDPDDRVVIAEPGATWEEIYLAASEHGLRTPYWGPLSGRFATVGGTLSNNSVFFGSSRYGSLAESVLGLEVVLGTGQVLHTGAWGHTQGSPFTRYFGPDLTGLFLGDTGAMAIKTKGALRLIDLPLASVGLAFSMPDLHASNACLLEMGRTGLAAEVYGFDPLYNGVFADLGFEYLRTVAWSLFVVVDGPDDALAEAGATRLREIGERHGKEIDASVPMAVRADPFGSVPQVLMGPEGQVWLPLHGLFPASKARAASDATLRFLDEHAADIEAHRIRTSFLTLAVGNDFLIEPSFYWHDSVNRFRLEKLEPEYAEKLHDIPPDLEARAVALSLRRGLATSYDELGCVHLQIGKWYDYERWLEPSLRDAIASVKSALDPGGLVNPGSLGLWR
jgi:D-lactate dehydrogenase (cytochrome)